MQSCLLNCFTSRLHLTCYDHVLQITRSIGDVYLKKPEFNIEPLHSKFRLQETFRRPLLSSLAQRVGGNFMHEQVSMVPILFQTPNQTLSYKKEQCGYLSV
jgi:hypothetical protein